MRRGRYLFATLTTALAVVAMTAAPAMAKSPTTVSLSVYAYKGKVSSPKASCLAGRTVVLKQKGHGVLGRVSSTETGKWEVPPEELHYKGPLPYKVYAEVKATSKCAGATSVTREIAGG